MAVNEVELLRALDLTEAAAARGLWDQDCWLEHRPGCGTAGCLAGNYALAAGCTPVWVGGLSEMVAYLVIPPDGDGTPVEVGQWVADRLGLDDVDSETLFDGLNTLEDLRRIVHALVP